MSFRLCALSIYKGPFAKHEELVREVKKTARQMGTSSIYVHSTGDCEKPQTVILVGDSERNIWNLDKALSATANHVIPETFPIVLSIPPDHQVFRDDDCLQPGKLAIAGASRPMESHQFPDEEVILG